MHLKCVDGAGTASMSWRWWRPLFFLFTLAVVAPSIAFLCNMLFFEIYDLLIPVNPLFGHIFPQAMICCL